jgi:hypothetical protein
MVASASLGYEFFNDCFAFCPTTRPFDVRDGYGNDHVNDMETFGRAKRRSLSRRYNDRVLPNIREQLF